METNSIFLIAHKCRGEPALDVAIQCGIAGEEAYIVCSSGHRAFPYWKIEIETILGCLDPLPEMPDDIEDHHTPERASTRKDLPSVDVLALLGMEKPQAVPSNFKRRF